LELTADDDKPIEGGKGAGQLVNDQAATCKDFLQVQKEGKRQLI
jgi:hypothetical protein